MCEVILSVYIPRNGISVVYDICMFNLLMTCTPFIHLKEFQLQISSCLSSNFPTSLLTSVIFFLFFFSKFITAIMVGLKWYDGVVSFYISLMTMEMEHFVMCLLVICIYIFFGELLKCFV